MSGPERKLSDWLDSYLEYTQDQESPEKLHLWTAFAIISAALRRRVWIDRGFFKLYPNIYVIMVAESARARKSTAMDIGISLLRKAIPDIHYITGSMTPEGLVKALNRVKVEPNYTQPESPHVTVRGDILIHADELATLFGYDKQRASRLAILLTEIYGSKDIYEHTIKTEAQIVLKNLYPTLLAGTDPRNLKVLPEEAVGGLIGRTIFVTAREKRKPIAWPRLSQETILLGESLRQDLTTMGQLEGEITITNEARSLFEHWYNELSTQESTDTRIDAFMERCHDTALKISILLSISRSNDLVVDERHVAGGIKFIEDQLPEFTRVASWAEANPHAQNRAKMIDTLKRHGGKMDRSALLKSLMISLDDYIALENTLKAELTLETRHIGKKMYVILSEEEMRR